MLKKRLVLKSYLPRINTSIFPKQHYDNIFSGKLVNTLHAWIENHPRVIHSPNEKYSLFVKFNGTLVKKHNHLLKISVQELYSYMILPIPEGGIFCARTVYGKVCIGDTSFWKYMPKYIKPMSIINNITCGCKTCISAMFLQSDINKWRLSQ